MTQLESLMILNSVRGFHAKRLLQLMEALGSLEAVLGSSDRIRSAVAHFPLKQEMQLIQRQGVELVSYFNNDYPSQLKEIPDPPILLYKKGELQREGLAVAIVGSRNASYYGTRIAKRWASQLAPYGIIVVSGMARGIDTMAHEGILTAGGRTIAVLGGGLGNIYPEENHPLAERIAERQGAVISEFPMQTPPWPIHFPQRNRIISGLSVGVIVVEAAEKSGALITARTALEQGRDVFAVPGSIDSPNSMGTHQLIQQGAKLVTCVRDVLEELAIPIVQQMNSEDPKGLFEQDQMQKQGITDLDSIKILKFLSNDPIALDQLVTLSGLSVGQLTSHLSQLVIEGKVTQLPGAHFALAE